MQFSHFTIYIHGKKIQDYRTEWRQNTDKMSDRCNVLTFYLDFHGLNLLLLFLCSKIIIKNMIWQRNPATNLNNKSIPSITQIHQNIKTVIFFNVIKFWAYICWCLFGLNRILFLNSVRLAFSPSTSCSVCSEVIHMSSVSRP